MMERLSICVGEKVFNKFVVVFACFLPIEMSFVQSSTLTLWIPINLHNFVSLSPD